MPRPEVSERYERVVELVDQHPEVLAHCANGSGSIAREAAPETMVGSEIEWFTRDDHACSIQQAIRFGLVLLHNSIVGSLQKLYFR